MNEPCRVVGCNNRENQSYEAVREDDSQHVTRPLGPGDMGRPRNEKAHSDEARDGGHHDETERTHDQTDFHGWGQTGRNSPKATTHQQLCSHRGGDHQQNAFRVERGSILGTNLQLDPFENPVHVFPLLSEVLERRIA